MANKKPRKVISKRALLNKAQVRLLRVMYEEGKGTQRELAKRFNISQPTVYQIINRKVYKYI